MRLLALLALAIAGSAAAQVEARVVSPDEPGAPRTFRRDTLVQRIELRGGTLELLAERDGANATSLTGRYVLRWNGMQLAASDDTAAGLPVVAAVLPGSPTVVALTTPAAVQVIVLEPARGLGGMAARAYSVDAAITAAGDPLRVVNEPENGAFALRAADVILRYADHTLRVEPAPSRGAGAALVAGGETAYVTAMKSDLRTLVTAEEAFFAGGARYTDRLQDLKLRLSPGNRLVRLRLTANGWTALMGNANTRTVCAVYVGATAAAPATKEGEPACI